MKVIKIKKYDNENGGETASTVYILSPNEPFFFFKKKQDVLHLMELLAKWEHIYSLPRLRLLSTN